MALPTRSGASSTPLKPAVPTTNVFAPRAGDALNPTVLPAAGFDANTAHGQARRSAAATAAYNAAIKRHNEAIVKARQASATARMAAATVGALHGALAPGSRPFGALSGLPGKGAADKYQPDLTAKSAFAATTGLRRINGGLLTPAQMKTETAARLQVANSTAPTFADKYQGVLGMLASGPQPLLPPPPPDQPKKLAPAVASKLGREGAPTPAPDSGVGFFMSQQPKGTYGAGAPSLGSIEKTATDALTRGLAQVGVGAGFGTNTGSGFAPNSKSRDVGILAPADPNMVKNYNAETGNFFNSLRPSPGLVPHTEVAFADLTPQARKLITKNGTLPEPKAVYLDNLVKAYGNGALGANYRAQLVKLAAKNNQPVQDAKSWSDAELAGRAFNKFSYSPFGFFQNSAADIGQLSASLNAIPMLVAPTQAALGGNFQPLVRTAAQFADQWRKHLIIVGDRPWYENAYESPFTTLTSNVPIIKGLGKGVGRYTGALSATREITLPTTGESVTVPASQNVFARPFTKVSDAFLARSEHPDVTAKRDAPVTVAGDIRAALANPVRSIGHRMEVHYAKKTGESLRLLSQLGTGHDARLALHEYFNAVRDLPTTARDLIPRRGQKVGGARVSDKQTRAETIIFHHGIGSSSDEAAAHAEAGRVQSLQEAEKFTALAKQHTEDAAAYGRAGDHEAQRRAENEAQAATVKAEHAKVTARDQELARDYSLKNPVDIHNPTTEELRLVKAARAVSHEATRMKTASGAIGEHGAAYGDLQHRLAVVHETQGPHSPKAIAEGTPETGTEAYRMADVLLTHREHYVEIRKELDRVASGKGIADRNSPAAKVALGKVKALAPLLKDVRERRGKVAAARAEAGSKLERATGTPRPPATPAETVVSTHEKIGEARAAAAAHEAANPGHTTRIETKKIQGVAGTPAALHWRNEGDHATASDANRAAKGFVRKHPTYETQIIRRKAIVDGKAKAVHQLQVRRAAKPAVRAHAEHTVHSQAPTPTTHPRRAGVPASIADQAEAAAQAAGAAKSTVRKIVESGRAAIRAKQERHGLRVQAAEKVAAEMERSQRQAHAKVESAAVAAAKRELAAAIVKKRAPEVIARLEANVKAHENLLEHGFVPDDRLVAAQAEHARLQAENSTLGLSKTETEAIASRHLKPAEAKAVGQVRLYHAVHEALYQGAERHLSVLERQIKRAHDEASARYEALSGSAADAQIAHDEHRGAFEAGLEPFRAHQQAAGSDPFHIPLRAPGQKGADKIDEASGAQFATGHYTRDVHIMLASDLDHTAAVAAEADLFRRISETPYVVDSPPAYSDAPPGFALVKRDILDSLVRPHLTSEENASLLDKWVAQSERGAPGEKVPEGGGHVLVSKDMLHWIKDTLSYRHRGENKALDTALKFTNMYRRWMLFSLPRTWVNNALGNPILAMAGGAGIMDYLRAIHTLRQHPELIPSTMRHRGPLFNAVETQKITGYQSFWRNANVFQEDLGRVTLYMHHVIRYARKEQGLKFYQKIDMASQEMTDLMSRLARGEDPKIHEFTKFANQWFGDMAKRGKWDRVLSASVLFHRWVGHMIHLTLWTMPLKYPGRTAFLLNLSHMADDYRKAHGVLPDWASNIVGLLHVTDKVHGLNQAVTWGVGTGGFNPWSTPAQTYDLGGVSNPKAPLLAIAANNLNPVARLAIEQAIGKRLDTLTDFKDTSGNPTGALDWRVLWNQIGSNVPVLNTVFPRTGQADTYRQGLDDLLGNDTARFNKTAARDPAYRSPTPLGRGSGWSGLLEDLAIRALGASGIPLRPIDAAGPRSKLSAEKTVQFQYKQAQTALGNSAAVKAGHAAATKRLTSSFR